MKNLFCEQRSLEMSSQVLSKVLQSYDLINTYSDVLAKLKYNELFISYLHDSLSKGYISFPDYISLLDEIWSRVLRYTAQALSKNNKIKKEGRN